MAITYDDLQGAMNALRQEIPGLIAPSILSLRTEVDGAMHRLNDAALVEIRQHTTGAKQEMTEAVDAKFQSAAVGFEAEQARLSGILQTEHRRLTEMVDKLSQDVQSAVEKVATVSGGKLDEVATTLIEQKALMERYKAEQEVSVHTIHQILRSEVADMHSSITESNSNTLSRMDRLEQHVGSSSQRNDLGSGLGPGGARGYQIRIPDPKAWNLTVLKNGDHGFLPWRKSFELQVRAIWAGMDQVLEAIREEITPMDRHKFEQLVSPIIPIGASTLDWEYTHISNKLYSVLYAHLDVDPIKIVEESSQRCGFEAYRLLSRAYDRYTPETEVALLNNILQMQQWSVKGIKQAESMMREAKARITIWQKRTKTIKSEQEPGMMIIICTLLFSKFDPEVRKMFSMQLAATTTQRTERVAPMVQAVSL